MKFFFAACLSLLFLTASHAAPTPDESSVQQSPLSPKQVAALAAAHKGPSSAAAAAAASPQYSLCFFNSPTLRYLGHWDKKTYVPNYYVSWYGAAQVSTIFTGSSMFIAVGNTASTATNFYVTVGSQSAYINGANGLVNVSSYISFPATGSKLLTIYTQSYNDVTLLEGLVLDQAATTTLPPAPQYIYEWVGDSITAGYTLTNPAEDSYAYFVSKYFNSGYVDLAFPSACLVDLQNCFNYNGMETMYFKTEPPVVSSPTPWSFDYTPTHVLMNLGTNDYFKINGSQFQPHVVSFAQNIRKQWPSAHIFVIRPFGVTYMNPLGQITPLFSNETLAAVQQLNAAGDKNVYWVNTTNWITPSDLQSDGVHPTAAGHIKIAGLMEPALQKIAAANGFGVKGA